MQLEVDQQQLQLGQRLQSLKSAANRASAATDRLAEGLKPSKSSLTCNAKSGKVWLSSGMLRFAVQAQITAAQERNKLRAEQLDFASQQVWNQLQLMLLVLCRCEQT